METGVVKMEMDTETNEDRIESEGTKGDTDIIQKKTNTITP